MGAKAQITCMGRVDGMGIPRSDGSYIELVYQLPGCARNSLTISEGAAEVLVAEIKGALDGANSKITP